MRVIEGPIKNLKIEDSKIHPLKGLEKQAIASSIVGAVASSGALAASSPIMLMAANGVCAKTFTAEINGVPIMGQFTTIEFKSSRPLIAVISEDVDLDSGRHLAYSILDPKQGLLYMVYEMGRSVSQGRKAIFKLSLIVSISFYLFFIVASLIAEFFTENKTYLDFASIVNDLFYLFILTFTFIFTVFFLALNKASKTAGKWSESIFSKLNFECVEKQDFYTDLQSTGGIHLSVMEYRKNLKGKDPYPEDYFSKKKS